MCYFECVTSITVLRLVRYRTRILLAMRELGADSLPLFCKDRKNQVYPLSVRTCMYVCMCVCVCVRAYVRNCILETSDLQN